VRRCGLAGGVQGDEKTLSSPFSTDFRRAIFFLSLDAQGDQTRRELVYGHETHLAAG
jgi:hypothetical protein